MPSGKKTFTFFKVLENSEDFTSSQEKFEKKVRKKNFRGTVKSHIQPFHCAFQVVLYHLKSFFFFTCYSHESCGIGRKLFIKLNDKLMMGFQENQSFCMLSIYVHCKWLADII